MSKMMSDCWLSPHGDVYRGGDHEQIANAIVEELGLNKDFVSSKNFPFTQDFLESRGWIKYSTHNVPSGWCITLGMKLTQAQIDKIYELTGEVFEDNNLLGPCLCLCAVIFLTKKSQH